MKKVKKYIISTLLTLVFCLSGLGVIGFFQNKNQTPYTQDYINYLKLSDEEKKSVEIIPQKYPTYISLANKQYIDTLNQYANTYELEQSYNLKDQITIYTDNQSQMGICWAYASVKSLETFMALNYGEYWNFSEGFVAYAKAKNMNSEIDSGGNWYNFNGTMNSQGVLSETFLPYENMNSITRSNMEYYSYLENYADKTYSKIVDSVSIQVSSSGINSVKSHIKQNGSLYTHVNSYDIKQGNNGHRVSNAKTQAINHAVSLIGWDDNFSTLNFPEDIRPSNNGAFLALNSWGPEWGNDNGVFYISYEDVYITQGYLQGFKKKSMNANETLKFEQSSPTSTYNKNDKMTNMFNLGDSVDLDYKITNYVQTAPNVDVTIKKNGVDITSNFLVNQIKTETETNVAISTDTSLEAGTYTIDFKSGTSTYIKSFVIISGAEISSIRSNVGGNANMFNTINGQTKTFSASYIEQSGFGKYFDVYVFFDKELCEIESISIDNVSLTYFAEYGKFNGTIIVTGRTVLDMIVTTTNGTTETYKIFVISNVPEELFYVNYNLNGGENSPLNPTRFDTESNNYYLVEPTKPNYTFDGWYAFEVKPENKITYFTNINCGNILLVANWKMAEIDYLVATFNDDFDNLVEESQGLMYGYTANLVSNFDFLEEDNLTLKWFINSQYYNAYDSLTSINLLLQVGSFTVECQASKDAVVLATQSKTYLVTKKTLTLTWQNTNFVYNGQNQAPTATIAGLIGTDTYPLQYVIESNDQIVENSISAGNYIVAVSNLSNSNYVIEENYEKEYSISKAVLTLTWQNTNFVYNGQNQAPSATVTGLIGTDTYPLQYVVESNEQVVENSIMAGNYKVIVSNLSNQNYEITENYEKDYSISKAVLTLTWQNTNFVYNGQNQAPTASVTGLIGTDTYPLQYVIESNDQVVANSITAGNYKVIVSNLSNSNYVIEENMEKIYTISKAVLTLTWQNTNFVYNGQNQAPSATVTGLIGTDTYPLQYVIESNEQVVANSISAGDYKAIISNLSNQNYEITENYEKNYSISKATLIINVLNVTAKYSQSLIDIADKFELNGNVYNNDLSINIVSSAVAHKSGVYAITALMSSNSNYNVVVEDGTYIVLEGKTYTYELPNGEKLVKYIDDGEEAPSINSIYNSKFSIITLKEIKNEDGNITYQVTEIAMAPIILIGSPILLTILLSIIFGIRRKRKWNY